ncbi:protein of unknown function [Lentzea fradiae]|uniref:DUF397 domain-containing protein n=1 Tax=Lentzea fradiae TaxID=200378 RepID=A0A1G8AFM1_9PSEU|nr:DUF397 domain-containing protein [Lentzea fradiae]SDH19120.1 protein of unknown function [Lentzea fradiae]
MATWRKSSYSGDGDNCVEVGRGIGIRDSKAPATHLPLGPEAWSAFLRLTVASGPAVTNSSPEDLR